MDSNKSDHPIVESFLNDFKKGLIRDEYRRSPYRPGTKETTK